MDIPFVTEQHFKNEDYTKIRLARADYEECIFEGCQFQNGFLDNQNFTAFGHFVKSIHFQSFKKTNLVFRLHFI